MAPSILVKRNAEEPALTSPLPVIESPDEKVPEGPATNVGENPLQPIIAKATDAGKEFYF